MKKKRKILLIIAIVLAIFGILGCAAYNYNKGYFQDLKEYFQDLFYIQFRTDWFLWMGKDNYRYQIRIEKDISDQYVYIDDGKKNKPIKKQPSYGYGKWYSRYELTSTWGQSKDYEQYLIKLYEPDYFKISGEDSYYYDIHVEFPEEYTSCRKLTAYLYNTSSVEVRTDKGYTRVNISDNFSEDSFVKLNWYGTPEIDSRRFNLGELKFPVNSFEVRRDGEGNSMVYVDRDGDGIYEYDCGEVMELPEKYQ